MRTEELLEAIGAIDSELIERNVPYRSGSSKMVRRSRWVAAAASLAVMVCAGIWIYGQTGFREDLSPKEEMGEITISQEEKIPVGELVKEKEEKYVEISELLIARNGAETENLCREQQVMVGEYAALYEGISAAGTNAEALAGSLGSPLEEKDGWYRVSGHEEVQYLIQVSEGEYSLWKFEYFMSEEYPYRDVLTQVYGIASPEEIQSVIVNPAVMDNTDEGIKLQREIGTREITDADKIAKLYDVLSRMICYGGDRWDLIEYGELNTGRFSAVRNGRYLTVVLQNGNRIDALKYTAVSGMFYEFGGVAYRKLSEEDQNIVEEILGMEHLAEEALYDSGAGGASGVSSDADAVGKEDGASQTADAPVDESTYREAHRYSDEVEKVQAAISQAMCNGELPFVTSSGIYENPVRIVVTVNTKDAAEIAKVKAFDTVDGIIEILYLEGRAVEE